MVEPAVPPRPEPSLTPGPQEVAAGATSEELTEFGVEVRSQTRMILGRFLRHKLAVASLVLLVLLVIVAFAGETLSGYSHTELPEAASAEVSSPPSMDHWFGTDELGYDVFSRVQRGAQRSIEVAFLVALLSTSLGTVVGAVAGYKRGWVDAILMRLTDLFLTIPSLAVLLVVASRFRGEDNWIPIVLVISGLAWMSLARLVRGVALSLREREFVEAARAVGATDRWIIRRHIIPNALGPVIVNATLLIAGAILTETALSFLGFGVQPPDVSLGNLISDGVQAARTRWWLFYPPGMFLLLFCLAVNFIGDGLRDAFDPQQSRVRA